MSILIWTLKVVFHGINFIMLMLVLKAESQN